MIVPWFVFCATDQEFDQTSRFHCFEWTLLPRCHNFDLISQSRPDLKVLANFKGSFCNSCLTVKVLPTAFVIIVVVVEFAVCVEVVGEVIEVEVEVVVVSAVVVVVVVVLVEEVEVVVAVDSEDEV